MGGEQKNYITTAENVWHCWLSGDRVQEDRGREHGSRSDRRTFTGQLPVQQDDAAAAVAD